MTETDGNIFQTFPGAGLFGAQPRIYRLPNLLKHEYITLGFDTQASYEKAAQMRDSPTPDVVTSVFMLFRGLGPDDIGKWAAARATAEDSVTFWTKVTMEGRRHRCGARVRSHVVLRVGAGRDGS
jgi:hypothetical protein